MAQKKMETLRLADFRQTSFTPDVEGVGEITPSGTEVPSGKVEEVKNAAQAAGVVLTAEAQSDGLETNEGGS